MALDNEVTENIFDDFIFDELYDTFSKLLIDFKLKDFS